MGRSKMIPISDTMKAVVLAFCIATPVLGANLTQRLEREETRATHGRHLMIIDYQNKNAYLSHKEAIDLQNSNAMALHLGEDDSTKNINFRKIVTMVNEAEKK